MMTIEIEPPTKKGIGYNSDSDIANIAVIIALISLIPVTGLIGYFLLSQQ